MKQVNFGGNFWKPFCLALAFLSLVGLMSNIALAASGIATVNWVDPTTDEGGVTPMTGLSGYRVYYDTTSHSASCPTDYNTNYVDVANATATSKNVTNLTPGQTYYFTVAAYDNASPANISGCATVDGSGATEVTKAVTYGADFDNTHSVTLLDYNTLLTNFGINACSNAADANRDCHVNLLDYNTLLGDFGRSF